MAGTGKSTVALTIARQYAQKKRLGASFFFSRGGGDLASAGKFATTIAAQLARALPELQKHMNNVVASDPRIRNVVLYEQWEKLVLEPLSQLGKSTSSHPQVIVVDALDECDNEDDVSLLIHCLADAAAVGNIPLRIFITSRPDQLIYYGFNRIPRDAHQDFILHDIEGSIVDGDLTLYYQNRLMHTAERFRLGTCLYSDEMIQILVRKSDRLFIHAATVCRFIHNGGQFAKERLSYLINIANQPSKPEKELYKMYTAVLEHSFALYHQPEEAAKVYALFNRVVGSIVVLSDTVTSAGLSVILAEPKDNILSMLHCLYSVLDVPEEADRRIRLVHPSFRDFLLDPKSSSNKMISVDAKATHRDLLFCCLRLMRADLRRNMCDIEWPGTRARDIPRAHIDRLISHPIQYACRNWIYHLQQSGINSNEVPEIVDFFHSCFLYWLEILAWIGRLSEGITMIRLLGAILAPQVAVTDAQSMLSKMKSKWRLSLRPHSPNTVSLRQTVYDAMRFLLSNSSIIEEAPLQTYCSAMLFSPEQSIIRRTYINQLPQWILQRPVTSKYWSSHLQTLAPPSPARTAAFSPDGRFIASAELNGIIRLWDATTGKEQRTFRGDSGKRVALAFSLDGQLVVSADRKMVRFWDVATGKEQRTLYINSAIVEFVAFSSTGQLIALGGYNTTVELYNAATGKPQRILQGHQDRVGAAAFSPDGRLVASASNDETVRLWSVATGKAQHVLLGHLDSVQAVAFSPDGRLVVSAGRDNTIWLWDAATGKKQRKFQNASDYIDTIVFLSDGRLVALAAQSNIIRLWDVATGDKRPTQLDFPYTVATVAFSPHSRFIAMVKKTSGSVQLWDATIGTTQHILPGHMAPISTIDFSPGGQLIASAGDDKTIRLWDAATGTGQYILRGHSDRITAIAFSTDGRLIASAGADKTVRLWDAALGIEKYILRDYLGWVQAVAFAPGGHLIAAAGNNKTVQLWNTATGTKQHTLRGHEDCIKVVVFSPDGQLIASAGNDRTIRLWDTATGTEQYILRGHSDRITAVAFSPDSLLIASTGDDKTVRLWDVATGTEKHMLKVETLLRYLAFSSCGSRLTTDQGIFPLSLAEPRLLGNTSISDYWLREDGRDILYLHPDYRRKFVFTSGNVTGFFDGVQQSVLQLDASSSKSMIY
ncbi:putative WD-repeat protein [Nemania serpens]|nr:putative WD-repeat protein [Nemania serpens]